MDPITEEYLKLKSTLGHLNIKHGPDQTVWVPTHDNVLDAMLNLVQLKPSDTLIDLGSGDGRVVIAAAQRGARAIGIEINDDFVALSRNQIQMYALEHRAEIRQEDFLTADLSEATVVTLFLVPDVHKKLVRKLANLKPGVRVVANTFQLWAPEIEVALETGDRFNKARIWKVY